MKLRQSYANEIAIRATAQRVRALVLQTEKHINEISAGKTFAEGQSLLIKKLVKKTEDLEAVADDLGKADRFEMTVALRKEQRELLQLVETLGQRLAAKIKTLKNSNKYDQVKDDVMRLLNFDVISVRDTFAEDKAVNIAMKLYNSTTLNGAVTLARVHEGEKPAIRGMWLSFVETTFIREAVSRKFDDNEFESRFDEFTLSTVKPAIAGVIKSKFQYILNEDGEDPDEDTVNFLKTGGKLDLLIDSAFSPTAKGNTVGGQLRKEIMQIAKDTYDARNE